MNFIETHDPYKKLQKHNAYTIMILYILYNATGNIRIIMFVYILQIQTYTYVT